MPLGTFITVVCDGLAKLVIVIIIIPVSLPVPNFHVTEFPAKSGILPHIAPAVATVHVGASVAPNKLSVNCLAELNEFKAGKNFVAKGNPIKTLLRKIVHLIRS